MKILRFSILPSVFLIMVSGFLFDGKASPKRIEGTFLQFEPWMMKLDSASWRCELDAMRRAGIDLIIIQWLLYENRRFIPADSSSEDPLELIMDYADEQNMKVFVGLATEERWHERLTVPRYLDRISTINKRLADLAWAKYGRHRAFAGWYIPQELRYAEYSAGNIETLRSFYRSQSDHCRSISGGKVVSISPVLPAPGEGPEPEKYADVLGEILLGSGIDVIFLQDGVGAHRGRKGPEEIVSYFRSMRKICRKSRVSLWADVEIFKRKAHSSGSEPASIERIRRQIEAETPFVEGLAMFDFFHYMSPCRGEAQRELYEKFILLMQNEDSSLP